MQRHQYLDEYLPISITNADIYTAQKKSNVLEDRLYFRLCLL